VLVSLATWHVTRVSAARWRTTINSCESNNTQGFLPCIDGVLIWLLSLRLKFLNMFSPKFALIQRFGSPKWHIIFLNKKGHK